MNKIVFLTIIAMIAGAGSLQAQKKGGKTQPKAQTKVQTKVQPATERKPKTAEIDSLIRCYLFDEAEDLIISELEGQPSADYAAKLRARKAQAEKGSTMLEATQKVVVVDSQVVSREAIAKTFALHESCGRLLSAKEVKDLLGNGVEGRNYVVREDGTLEFPEGKDMTNCGWTGLGASYSLPNCNGCPVWFYQPADYWKLLWDLNEVSVPSKALGFTFDPSPVADQVTACANVIAQYYLPLINGEVDIDSVLPVFQQALRDAGIDNIIAEKQAQLDAWLASK